MTNDFQRIAVLAKRFQQDNPKLSYGQARNRVLQLEQEYQTQSIHSTGKTKMITPSGGNGIRLSGTGDQVRQGLKAAALKAKREGFTSITLAAEGRSQRIIEGEDLKALIEVADHVESRRR